MPFSHTTVSPSSVFCRSSWPDTAPRAPTRARRLTSLFAPRRSAMWSITGRFGRPARPWPGPARRWSPSSSPPPRPEVYVDAAQRLLRGVGGGAAQQVLEHRDFTALLPGLELQLAAQDIDDRAEIDHAGHLGSSSPRTAPRCRGRGGDGLGGGDGERADTLIAGPPEWDSRSNRANRAMICSR